MTYRKKIVVLSALVAALAITYILTFVLDPAAARAAAFAWLDASAQDMADRVEIYGYNGYTELSRRNNVWFASTADGDYPVKQGRVDDLFAALSRKAAYSQTASSTEAAERLSLTENSASRITVRGGAGLPLLDLMIGRAAALGSEIYMRRAASSEIYSGEDRFTYFTDATPASWYDLRLLASLGPDNIEAVQQADLILPATNISSGNFTGVNTIDDNQSGDNQSDDDQSGDNTSGEITWGEIFTLRRRGGTWIIVGNENTMLEPTRVDAWLRSVLEAEADGFAPAGGVDVDASITLRLGDGTSRTIQAGPPGANGERSVRVAGSPYTYALGEWNFSRLWRESAYFIRD